MIVWANRIPRHFVTTRSKMDTDCAQMASKTQRQPFVEVSEVYLHIHSLILVYFGSLFPIQILYKRPLRYILYVAPFI